MSSSQSKDLKILGQIRERRLSKAQQKKVELLRQLAAADQALKDVNNQYQTAVSQADQRIAAIYDKLLNGSPHRIESVDNARVSESLIKEHLAALKKEIKEAENTREKVQQQVDDASRTVVELNAANEAIGLLNKEQEKEERRKQEKSADDVIDEVAERIGSAKSKGK